MLMNQKNPFLVEGYLSPEYFCDRVEETALLTRHLTNDCNVALIAPRRLGKSGLIMNCFHQDQIQQAYHCIYVDIYDTKNLSEFVYTLGGAILNALKSKGRAAWEAFLAALQSLKSTISFNSKGMPEWTLSVGEISTPDATLEEIFKYLNTADRPCLVAIDEFQAIATYPEKTVEATLRKHIQNCHNAHFVFSGSKRHMMAQMFATQAHPFYHSSSIMGLEPIPEATYIDFANRHFAAIGKEMEADGFHYLYDRFDGITWYIQYVLNMLYSMHTNSTQLNMIDVSVCISDILSQHKFAYQSLIYQLTSKQKEVLFAIAKEDHPQSVMTQEFLQKYRLGASTVQGAVKALLDKDFITQDNGCYQLCDKFLEIWVRGK